MASSVGSGFGNLASGGSSGSALGGGLGALGGAAGGAFGGPVGAVFGSFLGTLVGNLITGKPKVPHITRTGPRLGEARIQTNAYGLPIPIVYGSYRMAGNIIWASPVQEVKHVQHSAEYAQSGGGKGGGKKKTADVTTETFTYQLSLAIAICQNEITGINRIWANGILIFDGSDLKVQAQFPLDFEVYTGTTTQEPDPLIEAQEGAGNAPAFRGISYVAIKNFQMQWTNNAIPVFEFEVIANGTTAWVIEHTPHLGTLFPSLALDKESGLLWVTGGTARNFIQVFDPNDLSVVQRIYLDVTNSTSEIVWQPPFVYINTSLFGGTPEPEVVPAAMFIGDSSGGALSPWKIDTRTYQVTSPAVNFGLFCSPGRVIIDRRTIDSQYNVAPVNLWVGVDNGACASISNIFLPDFALDVSQGAGIPNTISSPIGWIYGWANVGDDLVATSGGGELYSITKNWDIKASVHYNSGLYQAVPIENTTDGQLYLLWYNAVASRDYVSKINPSTLEFTWTVQGTRGSGPLGNDDPYWPFITYDHTHDRLLRWSDTANGLDPHFDVLDTADGSVVETLGPYTTADQMYRFNYGVLSNGPLVYPGGNYAFAIGNQYLFKFPLSKNITRQTVPLWSICADVMLRVGLQNADFDVTALTQEVRGYAITGRMPAREAIEALRQTYFFDTVESDYKLKYVNRGGASITSIPFEDLGAGFEQVDQANPSSDLTRAQEVELPQQVSLSYIDLEMDYKINTQNSRRLVVGSVDRAAFEFAVVLTAAEAKQVIDVLLHDIWIERDNYKVKLPIKYLKYDPADVLTIEIQDGVNRDFRIVTVEHGLMGLLEWTLVEDDPSVYTWTTSGVLTQVANPTMEAVVFSDFYGLDLPMLRDSDNSSGIYVGAAGYQTGWKAAQLFVSRDAGLTYQSVAVLNTELVRGNTNHALPAATQLGTWDRETTLAVDIAAGKTLTSATEAALLTGSNVFLVGNELLQAADVQFAGSEGAINKYILRTFLRGRFGTEHHAIAGHPAGSQFVVIDADALRRIPWPTDDLQDVYLFKAVSQGAVVDQVFPRGAINTGASLKPWSSAQVWAYKKADGDWVIDWRRRARFGASLRDSIEIPLQENSEGYIVEIYDGATLVRTVTGLTSSAYTYENADQITDFGATQTSLTIRIYQTASEVARGFTRAETLALTNTLYGRNDL